MTRLWSSCAAVLGVVLMVQIQDHRGLQRDNGGSLSAIVVVDTIVGVFEGRTPCSKISNRFTGFPAQTCEKIKWELALFKSREDGEPTHYWYQGTRSEHRGRWTIVRHETHPDRTVYRLTSNEGDNRLDLLPVDGVLLLILDPEGKALVGDASWSYTLSRTDR